MTGPLYSCGTCRRLVAGDAFSCLHCGMLYPAVQGMPHVGTEYHSSRDQDRLADGTFAASGVRRLFDVEDVPVERMPVGHEAIDLVTGGGYARGASYAIHGPGGVGKSRVALLSCVRACSYGSTVYALATDEEKSHEVRRHAKDAGYFDDDFLGGVVRDRLICLDKENDPAVLVEKIRSVRPVFVVVDASSALDDQKYAAHLLRELAHEENAVVLSVFHETAEGKMAGGSKFSYLVDAILDMDGVVLTKKGRWKKLPAEEPSTHARLRSRKNRHGAQAVHAVIKLTTTGFDVVELCDGTEKVA